MAKSIVVPNYVLRLRRVVIHVDVGLSDTDTPETDREAGPHYLHAIGARVAPYIDGATSCVGPRSSTTARQLPGSGSVRRIKDEGDAR